MKLVYPSRPPLVHAITNLVTITFCANGILAVGASPVMTGTMPEAPEFTKASNCLLINLGTGTDFAEMIVSANVASSMGIPIVVDLAGAAASPLRREITRQIMECKNVTIKGNYSEIIALAKNENTAAGVDSTIASLDSETLTQLQGFANDHDIILIGTGKEDLIFTAGENKPVTLTGGHRLMATITGMGCCSSAVVAAFQAMMHLNGVEMDSPVLKSDYQSYSIKALALFKEAGKSAGQRALQLAAQEKEGLIAGPGTFNTAFLDWLYRLAPNFLSGLVHK